MIDLKKLNNNELMQSTDKAVEHEKKAVTNTTRHFQEIYRRRSYLPAYANMFLLLTQKYGFCNGSAQLRIGVIELIRQVPVVQEKIERGELSMTAAADIQTFLNNEKRADRPYSVNAKIELVDACLGKSTREVRKEFVRRNPEIEKRESVRYTSEDRVRLETSLSEAAFKKLNQLRDILSHVDPNMTLGSLIERLAEDGMNKYCPKRKAERALARAQAKASAKNSDKRASNQPADSSHSHRPIDSSSHRDSSRSDHLSEHRRADTPNDPSHTSNPSDSSNTSSSGDPAQPDRPNGRPTSQDEATDLLHAHEVTRYVPARQKHSVEDDGGGCVYVDENTGRRCGSTRFLQLDHAVPYSQGGANTAENLRWMCGTHNRWRYERRDSRPFDFKNARVSSGAQW